MPPRCTRQTEAEAIAFVIGKAVVLETGSTSADYIQLYHGEASLLAETLNPKTDKVLIGGHTSSTS